MKGLTPEQLLKKASVSEDAGLERIQLSVRVCKVNDEMQIVTGEVYAPYVIDSHGDMMEPEDVVTLAHSFMANSLNDRIDIMHNNKPALAVAVESFIAEKHPDYTDGAWVVSTKIHDDELWAEIKKGKYSGYSMEAMVRKVPAVVEIEIQNQSFGQVEDNDGHNHVFYVEVNDDGRVVRGYTSEDEGHRHEITAGTATESVEGHSHRFFLP